MSESKMFGNAVKFAEAVCASLARMGFAKGAIASVALGLATLSSGMAGISPQTKSGMQSFLDTITSSQVTNTADVALAPSQPAPRAGVRPTPHLTPIG